MGAAFVSDQSDVQWIVFLAILVHKGPSSFGLATFLLAKGIPRNRIVKTLFVFSIAAPVSAIVTFAFVSLMDDGDALVLKYRTGVVLLFSAGLGRFDLGTFLYVSAVHVLPEVYMRDSSSTSVRGGHHHDEKNLTYPQYLCLGMGMFLPLLLFSFGGSH